MKEIHAKADVNERVLRAAENAEEWFSDEPRMDWERFWDKLEDEGYSVEDMNSPAARVIESHVREYRRT